MNKQITGCITPRAFVFTENPAKTRTVESNCCCLCVGQEKACTSKTMNPADSLGEHTLYEYVYILIFIVFVFVSLMNTNSLSRLDCGSVFSSAVGIASADCGQRR